MSNFRSWKKKTFEVGIGVSSLEIVLDAEVWASLVAFEFDLFSAEMIS